MRFRTPLIAAASGTALALSLTSLPAQAAETRSACGYDVCLSTANGSATLYLDRSAGGVWNVCDDAPDGMRSMAEVRYAGQVIRLQTASGYGSCSSDGYLYPTPASGAVISLKVWVQDGSGGTPQYPGYGSYTWW